MPGAIFFVYFKTRKWPFSKLLKNTLKFFLRQRRFRPKMLATGWDFFLKQNKTHNVLIPTFDWNNFTQFRDHENDSTNVSFFTLISMLGAIFFYHVTTNDHFQQCIFKNATKFYPDSDVFDRKSWQYFESSVTFFFIYYFLFIFFFTDCADSPSFSLNSHPNSSKVTTRQG